MPSNPPPATRSTIQIRPVEWDHPEAIALRSAMGTEMSARYADRSVPESAFAVEDDTVAWTALALDTAARAVGHVALRLLGSAIEVKRMFVLESHRGLGVATALLQASHHVARDLGHHRVLLQTGDRQPDAVRVYERAGYYRIPIFAPYLQVPYSICMACDLAGSPV